MNYFRRSETYEAPIGVAEAKPQAATVRNVNVEARSVNVVPYITAQDLSLRYGSKLAFADINLTLAQNRITALIGPSGCGKTSFLSCINRLIDLIPQCTVTGSLHMGDTDVLAPSLNVITHRRRVGMIFQKPNPFPMSIRRNIELGLREQGHRHREDREQLVYQSLQDVGLWTEVKDRLDTAALKLSGGQQQRLCLARALALAPEVLLMDEPCSALDPLATGVVEEHIARLRSRVTILIVTHNLAQAHRLADEVALFWTVDDCGCLIETATAGEFFAAPRHPLAAAYVQGRQG